MTNLGGGLDLLFASRSIDDQVEDLATGVDVRHEERGDLPRPFRLGSTARTVRRESRRTIVMTGATYWRATAGSSSMPTQMLSALSQDGATSSDVRGGSCHRLDRLAVASGGDPDAEPAVAESPGTAQGGVGAPTDDDRNRYRRSGTICAPRSVKWAPWKSTGSPVSSWRTICRASSIRRPGSAGSTPQISTSWGSSPPMPTPNRKRPGARAAMSASWRATVDGMAEREQVHRGVRRQALGDRKDARRRRAVRRIPAPTTKLTWSPTRDVVQPAALGEAR